MKDRRKTQEAKDEAARLTAEAEILQDTDNVVKKPEALPNRLLDFLDDPFKCVDSVVEDETAHVHPVLHDTSLNVN